MSILANGSWHLNTHPRIPRHSHPVSDPHMDHIHLSVSPQAQPHNHTNRNIRDTSKREGRSGHHDRRTPPTVQYLTATRHQSRTSFSPGTDSHRHNRLSAPKCLSPCWTENETLTIRLALYGQGSQNPALCSVVYGNDSLPPHISATFRTGKLLPLHHDVPSSPDHRRVHRHTHLHL